jgi:hypothetical protein
VAPTMLWVADTGSFRNVAPSSSTELPTITIQLTQYMHSQPVQTKSPHLFSPR